MEKRDRTLKAVIFDMDGTMLDTEVIGARSWDHAGEDLGIQVPEEVVRSMVGRTLPDIHALVREALPHVDSDALLSRANHHYHRLVEARPPDLKPGLTAVLSSLSARNIPLAVATSSRAFQAESKLGRTGLRAFFPVLVAGDQIQRGKPDPEIFHRAAEALGLTASECAVFEDSGPGIEAARRAGCFSILVPERWPPAPELRAHADAVFATLDAALPLLDALLCP